MSVNEGEVAVPMSDLRSTATTGPDRRPERLRRVARASLVAPLVLAAALAGAAVFTVESAGCSDPGTLVPTVHGPMLVGGCGVPGITPGPAPHGGTSDQADDARRG